jgi:hypothetical protein
MRSKRLQHVAFAAALLGAGAGWASTTAQPDAVAIPPAIQKMAGDIAAELAAGCPLAAPGDTAAYNACRKALFGESALRASLPPVILWGRQSKKPNATLRTTNLTQFAPDVWTSMYAPLFMFNGRHTVEWVPAEKLFLVRLEAAFRNRLAPGQFPYPFWHDDAKWATYENARSFLLWISPENNRIRAAQFTDRAENGLLQPVEPVKHARHEGPWLWTDDKGHTQPAVTLFDGLYRSDNPHVKAMDRQYRDLALQMRESQCTSCHVPNNPDKMSRLVLLSTPVHAAGEIDRLIKAVKEDRMPMDDFRVSYALPEETKKWLLESAEAFKATVQAAQDWERQATGKTLSGPPSRSRDVSSTQPSQVTK